MHILICWYQIVGRWGYLASDEEACADAKVNPYTQVTDNPLLAAVN
jgi:hypothetical protein